MTKEEAKNFIKIDHFIFNKKTNQIVSLCSQWSEDFDYNDEKNNEKQLWVDNYNGFNVFPDNGATIKVCELDEWEPTTIEKLQEYPIAYCNYNQFRYLQLVNRLNNANINF